MAGEKLVTDANAVSITEDRIPAEGIEQSIDELVDVYGGEVTERNATSRRFILPLRRGIATAGGIECTIAWTIDEANEATVTLDCDRSIDAPRAQRVLMLVAGVIGAVMFMLWPFFPHQKEFGTLAWLGGIIALAVYFMSLRKTSGGLAHDFLQRLAARQRSGVELGE
jgi:hypothetical protein